MKYVFGALSVIIIIVSLVFIIATRGSDDNRQPSQQGQKQLVEYVDSSATVHHTVQGEINGNEQHNAIRISVSRNSRRIEIIKGYNGRVMASRSFPNTRQAFDSFLHALKNAGFSQGQESVYDTHKGVCPFGTRTIYQLVEDGETLTDLWSTSCGRQGGTFAGDVRSVRRLFEAQIPQYRELTREVDL